MALSDYWGKEPVSDMDSEQTKKDCEKDCSDFEKERAEFLKRIRVEESEMNRVEKTDRTDGGSEDDDADDMNVDNGMERERQPDRGHERVE